MSQDKNDKDKRFRVYFETDETLHAVANSVCKLMAPKEFFYEFVNKAIRERIEKLVKEGKVPAEFLKILNDGGGNESV